MNALQFDFEAALRICAASHRQQGQSDVAKLFEDGAKREAKAKYERLPEPRMSFEDWLRTRPDIIRA